LFSAFGYMKERTKDAGQLFVLTHNFGFFRQVRNWFHHLPNQRKKDPNLRPGRFYLLRAYVEDGRRTASLGRMDPLLEQYESEYHYLFKTIHDEANRADSEVVLQQYYGLPNIARRLLEAFLAFRHPDMEGDLSKRLDQVSFDSGRKTRILRLLHTYSHAASIADPEHDPTVLSETKPVLRDVLALIESVDPSHYRAMTRLVSAPEAGE
jgi:wobble nucleotide-excising tRNase